MRITFTLHQKQEHSLTLTVFEYLQVRAFQVEKLYNYHYTSSLTASNPFLNSLICSNSFTTSCDNNFNYLIIYYAKELLLCLNCCLITAFGILILVYCEELRVNNLQATLSMIFFFFLISKLLLSRSVPFSRFSALIFFAWKPFAISDHSFFCGPLVFMLLFFFFLRCDQNCFEDLGIICS